MRITDLLEEANLDRNQLNDQARWLINQEYDQESWIRASHLLVTNLDPKHTIPGNIVHSLWDICDQWNRTHNLTRKQSMFISNNLIDHWHQMTCQARAQLYY